MSVYRVIKNKNYTTMCNYHVRDKNISLKAIGLLTIFLTLPDDWEFSIRGTAAIVKDGKASVQSAMKELKAAGYLETTQRRDEKGKLGKMMYIIYEVPRKMLGPAEQYEAVDYDIPDEAFGSSEKLCSEKPCSEKPCSEKPYPEKPYPEKPYPGKPCPEKPYPGNPQPEKRDTEKPHTDMRDTDFPDTEIPSPENRSQINTYITSKEIQRKEENNKRVSANASQRYGRYQNVLLTQEEYDELTFDFPDGYQDMIENLSEYMYLHKRSYPNHLATMRAWARKDRLKARAAASVPQPHYDRSAYQAYDGESL